MKVYALIAGDYSGNYLVKIFRNEKDAEEIKVALNNMYDAMDNLDEQEDTEKHDYWESHQHITDKNRVMDDYHKQESYKIFTKAKNMAYDMLKICNAPAGRHECFVEEHELE